MSSHNDVQGDTMRYEADHDDVPQFDDSQLTTTPLLHSSALFILGLKEKYKLSQVALQEVMEGVTSLSYH